MKNSRIILISIFLFVAFFELLINLETFSSSIFEVRWVDKFIGTYYYEFFLGLVTFIILTLFVALMNNTKLLLIWFIKGFWVTLIFMLFYEWKYHWMDTYYYAMRAFIRHFPSLHGSGTENVASINSYFTYFVGNSYYSLKVLNAFIGFIGVILLYKTYEYIMQKNQWKIDERFIYIFFLFPTVLFWSSILGKDPLNLFFIGVFSYGFIHLIDNFRIRYIIMIIISIWWVSYIRSWWSVIMITSIFLYYIRINSTRDFLLFLIVLPIFGFAALQFLHMQGIASFDQAFAKMTETSKNLAYGGSSVGTHVITGIGDYLLYFIPNFFTSLYRPMPWDIRNAFSALAAIENVILLYLTYKYIIKNWKKIYNDRYLRFYIMLIFSWSLLYVIISPTNLGMAVRFKLQVLPEMLILIGAAMAMQKKTEEAKEKEVVFLAK